MRTWRSTSSVRSCQERVSGGGTPGTQHGAAPKGLRRQPETSHAAEVLPGYPHPTPFLLLYASNGDVQLAAVDLGGGPIGTVIGDGGGEDLVREVVLMGLGGGKEVGVAGKGEVDAVGDLQA